jgi:hypothetical protein
MIAFEVSVNGKRACVAGLRGQGVMSAIVNWLGGTAAKAMGRELELRVGGLNSETNQHMDWPTVLLKVGDEVAVRIVEVDQPDTPTEIRSRDDH